MNYPTPSAAAKSVTGTDVNGWEFWGIDAKDPSPSKPKVRKPRSLPRAGRNFSRSYKGRRYVVHIVRTQDGIAYECNGTIYNSPTGAARAITRTAVNGWSFWGLDKED